MRYEYYNDYGCKYITHFIRHNSDFNNQRFLEFVELHNRGDRDSGELGDIAAHEVLRLAHEWKLGSWNFSSNRVANL